MTTTTTTAGATTKRRRASKPTGPITVYGSADVATALAVSRATVSNWLARYIDTPPPAYVTPDGRKFWDDAGVDAWRVWSDTDDSAGA